MYAWDVERNEQSLTHYVNGKEMYSYALPRPVTDCAGDLQMGDAGLTLATLTLIPRSLSSGQISEMLHTGQSLQELALGQAPRRYEGWEAPPRTAPTGAWDGLADRVAVLSLTASHKAETALSDAAHDIDGRLAELSHKLDNKIGRAAERVSRRGMEVQSDAAGPDPPGSLRRTRGDAQTAAPADPTTLNAAPGVRARAAAPTAKAKVQAIGLPPEYTTAPSLVDAMAFPSGSAAAPAYNLSRNVTGDVTLADPRGFSVTLWVRLQDAGTLVAKQQRDGRLCWAWGLEPTGVTLGLGTGEAVRFPFGEGYRLPHVPEHSAGTGRPVAHFLTIVGRERAAAVYLDGALVATRTLTQPWARHDCQGSMFVGAQATADGTRAVSPFAGVRLRPVSSGFQCPAVAVRVLC